MSTAITPVVSTIRQPYPSGSCRMGGVRATQGELILAFGEPTRYSETECDGKVTYEWFFQTPRGIVVVGDYWWNRNNEHSIRCSSHRAALWVARYLRRLGFPAHCGRGKTLWP